jgi:hypothetical protein
MTINVTSFCDTEETRYALKTPWRVGDKVVASDGRIIVEIDSGLAPDVVELGNDRRMPKYEPIFEQFSECNNWRPFPDWDDRHCDGCNDTGLFRCKECDGTGSCECHCGHQHDCHECHGSGYKNRSRCPACAIFFDGEPFAAMYLRSIRQLPNVSIDTRGDKLYFKFDGGRGVLAAMVKETAKRD